MTYRHTHALALLAALALAACRDGDAPDDAAVSASVTTVAVAQGRLPETLTAYGTAHAAPDAAQVVSVQAAGRVVRWNVVAGAQVKRGQTLLRFALAPAAVAAYRQAMSAQQLAIAQRAHVAQLLAQQLATRDQLDQADKALKDAQSNLQALEQQQGRDAAFDVTAPFDGNVATIDAKLGDNLAEGAPLLTVQRGDGLVVDAGVERTSMTRVTPGASVQLVPIDGGATMHGVVRQVAHTLDARTHLASVEIVPDGAPVDGEAFRADIAVGEWRGWLLPRDAVLGEEAHRYVFQVANGKAVRVPVTILGESDRTSVASGALDARLPLVTQGAMQLDDGMAVRVEHATP